MLQRSAFWLSQLAILLVLSLTSQVMAQITWNVPGDFSTISAAITAANSGDTIQVAAGDYNENLSITKSLTLIGPNASVAALPESGWIRGAEAIVGSTAGGTRVVINGGASVIEVHISGFRFVGPTTGDAAGITIYKSLGSIKNNHFDNLTSSGYFGGADIYTQSGPGPWTISGNRHDNRGFGYYSGDDDEGTYAYSAINAWYLDDVTIHGNRIEGYGFAGIQLESTKSGQITSNYIKNVGANGIQVANGATYGIIVQGNTVDGASRAYEYWFGTDPIDPEYGWAGIRIWQAPTSAMGGNFVTNNRVINTPARVGAIGFTGSNGTRQTVGAVEFNSLDNSNLEGLLHMKAAVRSVSVTGEVATVCLWEGDATSAAALGRTNHAVGENVYVSGLGAPFDGIHEITAVDAPADTDYFGYEWYYKQIKFAVPGAADMPETFVQKGAAASQLDSASAIPAATNYWGGGKPDGAGASQNSAGASAMVSPFIKSYTEGDAPTGFITGIGFWPATYQLAPVETTLTFDGPFLDADGVAGTTLFATLSCTDADCVAGQTVVFDLNNGEYTASGTTDSTGKVSVNFNLPSGVYSVKVEFAGDDFCEPSFDEGSLTVASSGDAAYGGGWYKITQNPATRASFGFVAQSKTNKKTGVTTVTGQLVWQYHKQYRLKSTSVDSIAYVTLAGYSKSAQIGGWGVLAEWVPDSGNPEGGTWVDVGPVSFLATVCDGGLVNIGTKRKPKYVEAPDAFGISFPATGVNIPGETAPIQLSGGQIKVK